MNANVVAGQQPGVAGVSRHPAGPEPWRDPSRPAADRAADLLARMTLAEKLAQLSSAWLSGPADGDEVAPLQGEFSGDLPPFGELISAGLGQLTRVFG
ncbi:MAG TPA: hypothetical protein VK599_13655, partial [Streptosporangiaceae bacterium]|nr:hypothetical protein [Streptosporangiaceae bacterium]